MGVRVGSIEPVAFYVGESTVSAVYVGETLVWSASPPSPEMPATYGGKPYGSAGYGN